MKSKKGITLIALVITIIVLLILAGVSISMISGDDGIATKASQAAEKTKEKSDEEMEKLGTVDDYITEKVNQSGSGTSTPELTTIIFTYNGTEYTVDAGTTWYEWIWEGEGSILQGMYPEYVTEGIVFNAVGAQVKESTTGINVYLQNPIEAKIYYPDTSGF